MPGYPKKNGEPGKYRSFENKPHLRRNYRIRSVYSSLAIEANSLSQDEVRSIILSPQVQKLPDIMEYDVPYSALRLMEKPGLRSKISLKTHYPDPALENGLISMTIPDKPTGRNQAYMRK